MMIVKMDGRILIVGNEWFIPKFIKFQYASLLVGKPAILSVVRELFQKNCIGMIPESFGNDYRIISENYDNHCTMIKDKVKDTVKDKIPERAENIQRGDPGTKFSDDGKLVFFKDGGYQHLGFEQSIAYRGGTLRPRDVKRGITY